MTYNESIESRLCKLRIQVLGSNGTIPKSYLDAFAKGKSNLQSLSQDELNKLETLSKYLDVFKKSDLKILHWQKRHLHAFCKFIDDPIRCHQGRFLGLHNCKSKMKTLQHKQRETLVKVVTTLFTQMSVESLRVGHYPKEEERRIYDEHGQVKLMGVTHHELRGLYHRIWNESIGKTKWHDTLNMLKLAGFFETESCYIDNTNKEADIKRLEMIENGATKEEAQNAIPAVYSEASYKWFSHSFIDALGLSDKQDIIESKKICKTESHQSQAFYDICYL